MNRSERSIVLQDPESELVSPVLIALSVLLVNEGLNYMQSFMRSKQKKPRTQTCGLITHLVSFFIVPVTVTEDKVES